MSSKSHKLILLFYNMSTMLNIKHVNGKMKVSNAFVIFNFGISLIIVYSSIFHLGSDSFLGTIFKTSIIDFSKYSKFSRFLTMATSYCINASAVVLTLLQLYYRKPFAMFLNKCNSFSIDARCFKNVEKVGKIHSASVTFYILLVAISQLFMFMNPLIRSAIFSFITVYPYLIILSSITFVKNFENFVEALVKCFHKNLKLHLETGYIKSNEANLLLLRNYEEIVLLHRKFAKMFGTQLTTLVVANSITTTVQVKFCGK